jgi:hypothetical protein
MEEIDGRYEALIQAIPEEKKIKKLEKNEHAWAEAVKEREKELNDARNKKRQLTVTTAGNKKSYLLKIFNFFYSGRFLNYPVASFGEGVQQVPAVFIGFSIDFKKKNPYVPSQIKLRFAIASSNNYLAIPTSYSNDIMAVIGASGDVRELKKAALLDRWETYIQQTNVDRKQRHIITGNLLQAFSDFKGKLVSYTTLDGKTKKGILLPENWDPVEQVADKVTVPLIKALPLIKSLVQNSQIVTNTGLSFFKQGQQFKIIVGASRVKGGDIYLDKELLALVEGQNFQKTADKMVAQLDEKKIREFVRILQDNHGLSMTVNGAQFREIEKQGKASASRKPIELPPAVPVETKPAIIPENPMKRDTIISLLELEAEAIELELLLLAA